MKKESIFQQLNIFAQCRKNEIPLKQCPQFLFLVMGIIIIALILSIHIIGAKHVIEPFLIILIIFFITTILFIVAFIVTHSFEKLAEASRMKTEFLNIVSHQLRTPLTSLIWTIDLLMEEKDMTKKQEYFQILKKNSNRMQELISDLLMVSKITQGSFILRKKEVNFSIFIEDIVSQFDFFAQSSNIKMSIQKQEKLLRTFIDSSQIKIVVENLIENAIRYSKRGGELKILLEKRGANIYFEVKDSGVGIPEEDKKYIFKKFFRAKNVLEHQSKGSGLGLFISKLIIRALKGEIGFTSQENVGTTFWFTIPAFKD